MAGSGVAGEAACTLMINTDKVQVPTAGDIQKKLENKDPRSKADGLKQIILGALAGEDMGSQLMTVIRFCINEEDKEVKKLLMIFWEVIKKHDASGKLRPEMMLVCNALRNQLIHPNEFLRGCTLRFLCKVRERDVVEPLVPAITACLKHRVAYVRRNAVTLIHSLYSAYGEDVVPDAPATIMEYLKDERDNGALRNAFQMLFDCDQAGAVRFYAAHAEEVLGYGDGFHLSVLQLAKKVCRADPSSKVVFIRTILALLESRSATVAYEAASTLVALSNAPTAIRASTAAYTKLLASTPDNNVKLVLLERLDALRARGHTKILRDSAMDVLRVLATPNIDIRRRVIQLATALISERNVEEVVAFLKKQIVASQATSEEGGDSSAATAAGEGKAKAAPQSSESVYRGLLISAIHGCAVKYPAVASSVVHLLMDFLSAPSALDIIRFVREACERFPSLVHSVLEKLMEVLGDITSPQVLQVALWILGQYCDTPPTVQGGIKAIRECLGSLPLTAEHRDRAGSTETEGSTAPAQPKASSAPRTLPDGSYPSMTTVTPAAAAKAVATSDGPHLRRLLVEGDFFLGASIASTMCKLALRVAHLIGDAAARPVKGVTADAMLVMAAILELGQSQGRGGSGIDQDSFERIVLCMRVLGDRSTNAATAGVLLDGCKDSFKGYLAYTAAGGAKATLDASTASASSAQVESKVGGAAEELRVLLGAHAAGDAGASGRVVQSAHEAITIRQLRGRSAATSADLALDEEGEVGVAVEGSDAAEGSVTVQQLTGVGDPVYAEAKVQLLAYDIVLDITAVNRTGVTLTDVSVELATVGDSLKLVERPTVHTLAPGASLAIRHTIKVASTEAGRIAGTLTYTTSKAPSEGKVLHLNDITIDMLSYVTPAYIDPSAFRSMWAEFEWENKVAVNTNLTDLAAFVEHVAGITRMQVLTPTGALGGAANFLAANLYGKSRFGEDAIMNVCIELRGGSCIKGHIRIRAKTQGVALSLGDRITAKQKVDAPQSEEQ